MKTIEFIYDGDCPNADAARENLGAALVAAGLPSEWQEWDRAEPTSPPHARQFGSPTILIDGRDIEGVKPSEGADSCRLYTTPNGRLSGIPPFETIATALTGRSGKGPRWSSFFSVLPGLGASLLPVGLCPACWPAYAGVLGSLGLGSLLENAYLVPVTGAFLGLALFGLAYRARTRRGYRPLGLGVLGASTAMVGKFVIFHNFVLYSGLGLLLTASIWNSLPRKKVTSGSCASCAPQELETE